MNGTFQPNTDITNARFAATQVIYACDDEAHEPKNTKRIDDAADVCEGTACASARDVEACTMAGRAGLGFVKEGVSNGAALLCGRAARGAVCGATYRALPDALDGFIMSSWREDPATAMRVWAGKSTAKLEPPPGCRYPIVDGKPYLHILLCVPPQHAVMDGNRRGRLDTMCAEEFGANIAMVAPIGLAAKPGRESAGFCGRFNDGIRALATTTR